MGAADTPANRIIRQFGGPVFLARALGHRYPTRVIDWRRAGVIPLDQLPGVLRVARERGIRLTMSELGPSGERTGAESAVRRGITEESGEAHDRSS